MKRVGVLLPQVERPKLLRPGCVTSPGRTQHRMAKFCSRRTFIDVDEGTANQFRRSKSCPEFGIRDRATPEEPLSGEGLGSGCGEWDT